jgi:hypothetical protein
VLHGLCGQGERRRGGGQAVRRSGRGVGPGLAQKEFTHSVFYQQGTPTKGTSGQATTSAWGGRQRESGGAGRSRKATRPRHTSRTNTGGPPGGRTRTDTHRPRTNKTEVWRYRCTRGTCDMGVRFSLLPTLGSTPLWPVGELLGGHFFSLGQYRALHNEKRRELRIFWGRQAVSCPRGSTTCAATAAWPSASCSRKIRGSARLRTYRCPSGHSTSSSTPTRCTSADHRCACVPARMAVCLPLASAPSLHVATRERTDTQLAHLPPTRSSSKFCGPQRCARRHAREHCASRRPCGWSCARRRRRGPRSCGRARCSPRS